MSLSWADWRSAGSLYLGPGQVVLRSGDNTTTRVPATPDWAGALAALQTLAQEHHLAGRLRVVLSSHFAPLWLLPAPPTRLDLTETRGWVAAQVAERFGDLAAGWRLVFRPAPAGAPILASGIDAGRWAELLHVLAQAGLTATQIAPWPALALARRSGRESARLALLEVGRLTLVSLARGEVIALSGTRGEAAQLPELTARAALVDELGDVPLHLLATGISGEWVENRSADRVIANTPDAALPGGACDLDFIAGRPRRPLAAWLLLAVGVGLAGLAGQRYADLSEQLATLAPPATATPTTSKSTPPRKTGIAAKSDATPTRNWGELLNPLESLHEPRIALLSLHGDAQRGEAKITAEARNAADMLDWLATLRQSGFADASPVRHASQLEDEQQPVKFEIRLGWGTP